MKLNEAVQRIAATVSRDPLSGALHRPESWATPSRCWMNVQDKNSRAGGGGLFGWTFHLRKSEFGAYLFLMHHAVWLDPSRVLIDVTPFSDNHEPILNGPGVVLFLVDQAAVPIEADGVTSPRPSQLFALDDSAALADYVRGLNASELQKCDDERRRALEALRSGKPFERSM